MIDKRDDLFRESERNWIPERRMNTVLRRVRDIVADNEEADAVSGYKGYFESLESISIAFPNPTDAWHAYRDDGHVRYYALNGSWREELLILDAYATIIDIEIGNQVLVFENSLI